MYLLLLLVIYKLTGCSCQESDLMLTVQSGGRNLLVLTCITNDIDKALVWEPDSPRVFYYRDDSRTTVPNTTSIYADATWLKENSLANDFGPILDGRWEKLREQTWTPVSINTNGTRRIVLPISVKSKRESNVYICAQKVKLDETCYWILLGAWNGTASAITKCTMDEGFKKTPSGNCTTNLVKVEKNPLAKDGWKHFTITLDYATKTVNVTFVGERKVLMTFKDEEFKLSEGTSISVRERDSDYWKLHTYDFYVHRSWDEKIFASNIYIRDSLCISMYISMCDSCGLILSLKSPYSSVLLTQSTYDPFKDATWRKIRFRYNKTGVTYAHLLVRIVNLNAKTVLPFLAIDNVLNSTNCFYKELKYASFSIERDQADSAYCQFLTEPNHKLRIQNQNQRSTTNCSFGSIGGECLVCSDLHPYNSCENLLICNTQTNDDQCYCSAGSTGDFCQQVCPRSTFGLNCDQRCTSCEREQCSSIDGTCIRGCKDNFSGKYCQQAELPILRTNPLINSGCINTCVVKFNSTDYVGMQEPIFYRLQYKISNYYKWTSLPAMDINSSTVTISNLTTSTNYTVRIVLLTKDLKSYEGTIPLTHFATSCIELNSADVAVHPESRRVLISIPTRNETYCNISTYSIIIVAMNKFVFKRQLSYVFDISNLLPFHDYDYTIYNKDGVGVIKAKFRTDESAPSAVTIDSFTSTQSTITIKWSGPKEPFGIIRGFTIHYEHKSYIHCPSKNDTSSNTVTTKKDSITLYKLIPYSIYTIKILAINKYPGKTLEFDVKTKATDSISRSAYNITADPYEDLVDLKITEKCEKISSPINMKILLTCVETWCNATRNVEKIINTSKTEEILYGLAPFSNYSLVVTLSSNQNFEKSVNMTAINFTTKATTPNRVEFFDYYAKNLTSISLRWLPPYPPTGSIEGYELKYGYNVFRKYLILELKTWDNCIFWPRMYCTVLTGLRRGNFYSFEISAKNIGIATWSPTTFLDTHLSVQKPTQPENLRAYWDNHYNLTVEWQHPNKTDGTVPEFLIKVGSLKEERYRSTKENSTYFYTIPLRTQNQTLKIAVATLNNMDQSPYNEIEINCPPPVPELSKDPEVKPTVASDIVIQISPAKDQSYNSSVYVVMLKMLPDGTYPQPILRNGILSFQRGDWWIARHYTAAEVQLGITMVVGDGSKGFVKQLGSSFFNRKLEPGKNYQVYVVVYNEYMNERRAKFYTAETYTQAETNTSLIITLVVVAGNLIIFALFGVLIWRCLKKKRTTTSNEYFYEEPYQFVNNSATYVNSNWAAKMEETACEEHQYEELILPHECNSGPEYENCVILRSDSVQYDCIH